MPISPRITWPSLTISTGRPPGAISSLSPTMPRHWYIVVAQSSTVSGLSCGSLAVASELPYTVPRLMPPPAITMLNTLGQWSRPAVPLIFGVRPNSVVTHTSVESSSLRRSRSRISAANA